MVGIESLSPNQLRLGSLIADGLTLAQAAHAMGMSLSTAKTHLSKAYRRADVNTRTAFVNWILASRPGADPHSSHSAWLRLQKLTSRQREVYDLAVAGHKIGQIARRLYMGESTVKTHLSEIYRKLDVSNRAELAALNTLAKQSDIPADQAEAISAWYAMQRLLADGATVAVVGPNAARTAGTHGLNAAAAIDHLSTQMESKTGQPVEVRVMPIIVLVSRPADPIQPNPE